MLHVNFLDICSMIGVEMPNISHFFTLIFSKHPQNLSKSKKCRLILSKNELNKINKSQHLTYLFSFIADDNYAIPPVSPAKAVKGFSDVILTLP